jgi:hypothetical protein
MRAFAGSKPLPADPLSITSDGLEDFPLAEYTEKRGVDHVQFENVSRNVEDGMKQTACFAICIWICDPAILTWQQMTTQY